MFLLIDLYREKEEEFVLSFKRNNILWAEIAITMKQTNEKYNVSGLQCKNKWAGLKRTYNNICDQNKRSGNCRNSWAFFSVIIRFINTHLILTLILKKLSCIIHTYYFAYILI